MAAQSEQKQSFWISIHFLKTYWNGASVVWLKWLLLLTMLWDSLCVYVCELRSPLIANQGQYLNSTESKKKHIYNIQCNRLGFSVLTDVEIWSYTPEFSRWGLSIVKMCSGTKQILEALGGSKDSERVEQRKLLSEFT